MKLTQSNPIVLTITLLSLLAANIVAMPLGTAFTYQGQLNDGTNAANGNYDLTFSLFDASTNGVLVAGPVTNSAAAVSNGQFAVTLDFGSAAFNGEARWLEIGVRTNGAGGFTTLSPRQTLRPIPYALYAMNANLAGIYPKAVAFTNSGNTFVGAAAGLTDINASEITSGTLDDARLSANVALLNRSTNKFLGKLIAENNIIGNSNIVCNLSVVAYSNVWAANNIAAGANIYARTNISAGGDIYAGGNISAGTNISAGGDIYATTNLSAGHDIFAVGDIYAGSNILAGGEISATKFTGDGSGLTNLAGVNPIPRMQVFTTNGTFTVSNGTLRVMVEVWGGGGGGAFAGGGGGGGGYGKQVFELAPGTYDVVVGEGGVAGAGVNSDFDPPAPGSAGGNSSFSDLITSYGGSGGQVNPSAGGLGGTSTGDFSITGGGGDIGSSFMYDGGSAGCGGFGGKLQARSPSVYVPPSEPGGGGVGEQGQRQQNGAKGRVIVYY